jgi:acyl dehydratase
MHILDGLDALTAVAGLDLGTSDWLTITQDRVDGFAESTGDHQWIHVDQTRAAAGPFGTTIAHGYLTLSLVIPLMSSLLTVEGITMGINYGLNRVRFPAPVPVGSRIRLHATVTSAKPVTAPGPGAELVVALTVELDGADKPAAVAEAVYRYYA